MQNTAITGRMPPVTVAYDGPMGRRSKRFTCPYKARRFYAAKFRAGKSPQVKKGDA